MVNTKLSNILKHFEQMYKFIFVRLYHLLSNSKVEWADIEKENETFDTLRKKYFFPLFLNGGLSQAGSNRLYLSRNVIGTPITPS